MGRTVETYRKARKHLGLRPVPAAVWTAAVRVERFVVNRKHRTAL